MQVLVTGWFSFENMGTTAGDLMCMEVVAEWLDNAGFPYRVALLQQYEHEKKVSWLDVDPQEYTDIIFVCGPFGNGWPVTELLNRFSHCRLTGINLSLLQKLEEWNPFTLLFARDYEQGSMPDISFGAVTKKVPVIGLILSQKQREYGNRSQHEDVHATIDKFLEQTEASIVPIDTRLPGNTGGLRSASEVESLIAAMDIVITTRLHGTVLAIKNGVPAIAIDPVFQSAKISAQAQAIKWPVILKADNLSIEQIREAYQYCLTNKARNVAKQCAGIAKQAVMDTEAKFKNAFALLSPIVETKS